MHDTKEQAGQLVKGITAEELHQLMQDIPAGQKTLVLDTHASETLMETVQ